MSKKPPRHHELPRYYLRDFCSPEKHGHIWVFERDKPFDPSERRKRDNNPYLRGINQAGLHPQGYVRLVVTIWHTRLRCRMKYEGLMQ